MQLHLETPIDASADAVWAVLGRDFAGIERWSSTVEASRPIDKSEVPSGLEVDPSAPVPGRETTTKITLIEVLTAYSDNARSLTFVGVGLPPIITEASNVNSVRPTGENSSVAVFDVSIDFKGPFAIIAPLLKRRMAKTFGIVQHDLKAFVESGA